MSASSCVRKILKFSPFSFKTPIRNVLHRRLCTSDNGVHFLERGENKAIAYRRLIGENYELPGIVYCSGFQSNMHGTKANALETYCKEKGLSFVRFDYQGCGQSSGDIRDCTLSDWRGDALAVIDQLTAGPQIMIGTSMGGLIILHTCLERPHRIHGLLGISTSADMPDRRYSNYPAHVLETIERDGEIHYVSDQHSYIITKKFIEDAKQHSILTEPEIPINCQVRLLHGLFDEKVPYQVSLELSSKLTSKNVHVLLRKGAKHRFSQPDDITVIFEFLNCMVHGVKPVKDLALKSWQSITIYSHPKEENIKVKN